MKILSLKLQENIFNDIEEVIKEIDMPRNAYINKALFFFNKIYKRKLLRKQLEKESQMAAAASLEVLREMEQLEEGLA